MDVSNASVYDGATAAAEAVGMCRERKRQVALVSATTNPDVIEVIKTYCHGANATVEIVPEKDGVTDMEALKSMLCETSACFYVQQPNYYGIFEDCEALGEITHASGAKYIMGCNPIALGIMKSPGECGADVATAEGQPLGMSLAFGGPYLGIMACTTAMMRKMPGRIVGETVDADGQRCYVLTLQAREQHIRREKASSNICSNQNLCALTASVYLASMGNAGLQRVAQNCYAHAHYLADKLAELGFMQVYKAPFFHEFVTRPPLAADKVMALLEQHGILGGLPLANGNILWCATEMTGKEQIDELIDILEEVAK